MRGANVYFRKCVKCADYLDSYIFGGFYLLMFGFSLVGSILFLAPRLSRDLVAILDQFGFVRTFIGQFRPMRLRGRGRVILIASYNTTMYSSISHHRSASNTSIIKKWWNILPEFSVSRIEEF